MSTPESKYERETRAEMPALLREAGPNERMAHLIKLAFRGLSRALQMRLRKHSLLYGHWTLLRILWRVDGMTQRQLSEQAGVREPTAFAALQAMEKLGYLTRQKMPNNSKEVRIFLTPKGTALRSLIVPAAEEVNRIALSGILPDDLAVTRRTLLTAIENLCAAELVWPERKAPVTAQQGDNTANDANRIKDTL